MGDDSGIVKIYRRGLDFEQDGIPDWPALHFFLEDWSGKYYELHFYEPSYQSKSIKVRAGNLEDMSKATRCYLKDDPQPYKTVLVNKTRFTSTVAEFIKKYDGEEYNILDFSKNCIGFEEYVIKNSIIKEI